MFFRQHRRWRTGRRRDHERNGGDGVRIVGPLATGTMRGNFTGFGGGKGHREHGGEVAPAAVTNITPFAGTARRLPDGAATCP